MPIRFPTFIDITVLSLSVKREEFVIKKGEELANFQDPTQHAVPERNGRVFRDCPNQ